jgi:hypothetical protein
MAKYYQTSTGYGYMENDNDDIPAGATPITEEQYNALVAAAAAAEQEAIDDQIAALNVRWTTVHDALLAGGISESAATILADAVGMKPAAE